MELESEAHEWNSFTFEWKLKGLRNLFESTKGDTKSKVARSGKFDKGRWQILFYANAGTPRDPNCPDGYVSLYLSCDPTPEEREAGLADSGRWMREGTYKFSFELRNIEKTATFSIKEATNHTFSSRTANWGWAQFARRDTIYYNCPATRTQDAFLIICTVVSSPRQPTAPLYPYLAAPKGLLDTVGSLLDDPLYSDVEFVFTRGGNLANAPKIYASKKLLSRAEYFATMFASEFVEGLMAPSRETRAPIMRTRSSSSTSGASTLWANRFEDSDEESEDDEGTTSCVDEDHDVAESTNETTSISHSPNPSDSDDNRADSIVKLSRPGTPSQHSEVKAESPPATPQQKPVPGPPKTVILVKDVAYRTYRAILYWLYTDHMVFAPLSSSFNRKYRSFNEPLSSTAPTTPAADGTSNQLTGPKRPELPATRTEWIKEWTKEFPHRAEPCSAKAVYRVADKIDLPELKERAAQHILKSLTVENIAYEVFSPFSATFEDIRKVEIAFFLEHWKDIRSSESMAEVWRQIRSGRHPGFEEVWPLITQSLEFRPTEPQSNIQLKASTAKYYESLKDL